MSQIYWLVYFKLFITTLMFNLVNTELEYLKREHSLTKPYQGTGMVIPFWDFYGATMVTNAFVRLTPDQQSKIGGLFNAIPLQLKNWEIHLHFKVGGKGKDLYGDGFAFWYVKEPLVPGSVFGYKDHFTGLGVFFDTYANQNGAHDHGHPYISAMINNGTLHYDHDKDGTHTEIDGCKGSFRGTNQDSFTLIRYENDVLSVLINFDGKDWKECFKVSGVILPTGYYVGVSAATGDLSDNHDIISIKTYELEVPQYLELQDRSKVQPSTVHFAPPRERIEDGPVPMSNLKFFFLIVCAIIAVILLVAVGMIVFQKQQETSRKRFY